MPINRLRYIIGFGVCLVIGAVLYIYQEQSGLQAFLRLTPGAEEHTGRPAGGSGRSFIKVSIKGCVKKPGSYSLPSGSVIEDLICACEGMTRYADLERVRWKQALIDGDEYFISRRRLMPGECININQACAEELCMIPEITKETALAIVEYRKNYEQFEEPEELMEVAGISRKKYDIIKEYVRVGE